MFTMCFTSSSFFISLIASELRNDFTNLLLKAPL